MSGRRPLRTVYAAVGLAACGCVAYAGVLRVGPTRLELTPQRPVAVLEVRNEHSAAVLLQVESMQWTQEEGEESYQPTRRLMVTPPVVQLAPGATQIVRIGVRAWADEVHEGSFRVYVHEILTSATDASGVRVALRVGVPVFVDRQAGGSSRIQCALQLTGAGQLRALVRNSGDHWEHVLGVEARDRDTVVWRSGEAGYLLAGGGRLWSGWLGHPVRAGDPLDVVVTTDSGRVRQSVSVSP